jgi:hypothetical protein
MSFESRVATPHGFVTPPTACLKLHSFPVIFSLLFQVDVYKEILSLEVRESEERPADDDNQLFRQVCDQLRYIEPSVADPDSDPDPERERGAPRG